MTPDDLARFRKILGLLGSDQVGERAAAAKKASEFLASHSLSWSDVTLPVSGPDVLAQRREAAGENLRRSAERPVSDLDAATVRNYKAAQKAQWAASRYGADEDGFETGRK